MNFGQKNGIFGKKNWNFEKMGISKKMGILKKNANFGKM